ncbi:MAG TPA: hypothetical protein VEJ18_00625 [Planctomycetota bacterium]|nr:hypothetical protein [Planctomycetota bacterium]
MAFQASFEDLLAQLEKAVDGHLDAGWAAEPPAARAALLVREALEAWTRSTYPGSSCEGSALDPGSRRRLALRIHSAPVTHHVQVWGSAQGEPVAPAEVDAHTQHSWVVLAHLGEPDAAFLHRIDRLADSGLRKIGERRGRHVMLNLWMGTAAPDGCPDCGPKS